jgi:hypothetical protein
MPYRGLNWPHSLREHCVNSMGWTSGRFAVSRKCPGSNIDRTGDSGAFAASNRPVDPSDVCLEFYATQSGSISSTSGIIEFS